MLSLAQAAVGLFNLLPRSALAHMWRLIPPVTPALTAQQFACEVKRSSTEAYRTVILCALVTANAQHRVLAWESMDCLLPNGIWNENGSLNAKAAPLKNHTVCRGAANGGCAHCHASATVIVDACAKGSTDADCSWLLQRARKARLIAECNPNCQVSDIADPRVSEATKLFHIPFPKNHRLEIERGPTSVVYGCARRDMVVVLMDAYNQHNCARGRMDLIDRAFKDMVIMPTWQLPDRFRKDFPANGHCDPEITDEQRFAAQRHHDDARKILSAKRHAAAAAAAAGGGGGDDNATQSNPVPPATVATAAAAAGGDNAIQSEPVPPATVADGDGGGGGGDALHRGAAAADADMSSGGVGSGREEQERSAKRLRVQVHRNNLRRPFPVTGNAGGVYKKQRRMLPQLPVAASSANTRVHWVDCVCGSNHTGCHGIPREHSTRFKAGTLIGGVTMPEQGERFVSLLHYAVGDIEQTERGTIRSKRGTTPNLESYSAENIEELKARIRPPPVTPAIKAETSAANSAVQQRRACACGSPACVALQAQCTGYNAGCTVFGQTFHSKIFVSHVHYHARDLLIGIGRLTKSKKGATPQLQPLHSSPEQAVLAAVHHEQQSVKTQRSSGKSDGALRSDRGRTIICCCSDDRCRRNLYGVPGATKLPADDNVARTWLRIICPGLYPYEITSLINDKRVIDREAHFHEKQCFEVESTDNQGRECTKTYVNKGELPHGYIPPPATTSNTSGHAQTLPTFKRTPAPRDGFHIGLRDMLTKHGKFNPSDAGDEEYLRELSAFCGEHLQASLDRCASQSQVSMPPPVVTDAGFRRRTDFMDSLQTDNESCQAYTGELSFQTLRAKLSWLDADHAFTNLRIVREEASPDVDSTAASDGQSGDDDDDEDVGLDETRGRARSLSVEEQWVFFLTVFRKFGFEHIDHVAYQFGIKKRTGVRYFDSWLIALAFFFEKMQPVPTFAQASSVSPARTLGRLQLSDGTAVFLGDCTEVQMERPSIEAIFGAMFSFYKHNTTAKYLTVGIGNTYLVSISAALCGGISDNGAHDLGGLVTMFQSLINGQFDGQVPDSLRKLVYIYDRGITRAAEALLQVGVAVIQPHRREDGQFIYTSDGANLSRAVAKVTVMLPAWPQIIILRACLDVILSFNLLTSLLLMGRNASQ